jgi:hypothetical protein
LNHITYKFLSDDPIELGRLPERLLFPRNLVTTEFIKISKKNDECLPFVEIHFASQESPYKKVSELIFNKVCGTCPVILLKLKSL